MDTRRPPELLTQLINDPYPVYANLRKRGRAIWHEAMQVWLVPRYADVEPLLKDPTFSKRTMHQRMQRIPDEQRASFEGLYAMFTRMMMFSDPPEHAPRRHRMVQGFTGRMLKVLEPEIRNIACGLLDRNIHRGEFDFIKDFAHPLPAMVIAQMLGADPTDYGNYLEWSACIAEILGAVIPDVATHTRIQAALESMSQKLRGTVDYRRVAPRDDYLSQLLASDDGTLSEEEFIAQCVLLMVAGHETTRNLLGNGLQALLRYPEQMHLLREHRNMLGPAIEEMIRFDSPVQFVARAPTRDVRLGDNEIPAGQMVLLLIGSANRDPEVSMNPDAFDITRSPCNHLSFGYGPHFCLGASLARLEARITFDLLLERLSEISLVSPENPRIPNPALRGMQSLPIRFR